MKRSVRHATAVLFLALLLPAMVLAADYQSDQQYGGFYANARIYKLNKNFRMWDPDRQYPNMNSFKCQLAADAFAKTGTWTGVVYSDGTCAENAEAPQRATGNYLNYLQSVAAGEKQPQGHQ